LYVVVWYRQRNNRTTVNNIRAGTHQFKFNEIPVVFKNTSDKEGLAFVRSDGENDLIVIDSQLREELSDDEIEAICYHELYHITHDSMRYQTRIETPVIGHLLFFLSTNLERLYNDEYRADEFAAQQSSAKTLLNALRKTNSLTQTINKSKIKTKIDQGWWGCAEILCSPPVLKLYSPPTEDRIARLEEIKNQQA
jgi:Zn-dependent protease with chaperone function